MRVGFRDEIAASKPVSPDIAELIEVIVASAGDEVQALEWRDARLEENRRFFRVIADEGRLRSKSCETNGRSCPAFTRL